MDYLEVCVWITTVMWVVGASLMLWCCLYAGRHQAKSLQESDPVPPDITSCGKGIG